MGVSPSVIEPLVDGKIDGTASYGGGAVETGATGGPLTGRSPVA
jgi:hypothetical protein